MKKYLGFTIIELMITLILVSILLMVGIPSLKNFLQKNQLIASSNELLSALHIARSEAIKINKRVTVCASSKLDECNGGTNWKKGWIVFIDENGDLKGEGTPCTDMTKDCLLRVHEAITDPQLAITGASSYTFTSRGLPKDVSGSSKQGVFSLCSRDSSGALSDSRAIKLALSGRVRITDEATVATCP